MKSDPVEAAIEAMERPKTPLIDSIPAMYTACTIALKALEECPCISNKQEYARIMLKAALRKAKGE